MAKEYIEKETAMKAAISDVSEKYCHDFNAGMARAYNKIKDLPAANVRENVRGRWRKYKERCNKHIVECSICGNMLDMRGVNAGRGDANFCPNCGADMRGGDDG